MTNSKEIARIADVAMYEAEPDPTVQAGSAVHPTATLISMTPNPLRTMAAASGLYSGRVVRDVGEVSKDEALAALASVQKTTLKAPLEFIDLEFLLEGVTRNFTHQLVRQRTGVYVQESLRFAVKRGGEAEVAMPPSIARLKEDAPQRIIWENSVHTACISYERLVDSGIPAEDARGLLPSNITTRVHYKTNLRNLADHAGYRLCSQAQYEWKQVWQAMINAILDYPMRQGLYYANSDLWQYQAIAGLFKPICYETGKCEFMGAEDRFCSIRVRVENHHERGEKPETWTDIDPREPLRDGAARLAPEV